MSIWFGGFVFGLILCWKENSKYSMLFFPCWVRDTRSWHPLKVWQKIPRFTKLDDSVRGFYTLTASIVIFPWLWQLSPVGVSFKAGKNNIFVSPWLWILKRFFTVYQCVKKRKNTQTWYDRLDAIQRRIIVVVGPLIITKNTRWFW